MNLWHQWLGHLCDQQMKHMVNKEMITDIKLPKGCGLFFCEGCVEGKMHRKPFQPVGVHSSRGLNLVHSDVCGAMPTESLSGHKYFVTFIDDCSHCCAVYFLKHQSEVLTKFKEFEATMTNDCGHKIEALKTDNGSKYISNEFKDYLKSRGICYELTVLYTPEQNGVAKRLNRTLMEADRFWIKQYLLGRGSSNYSLSIYCSVITATDKTPYKRWYGRKSDLSNLRLFGCIAYV